MLQPNQTLTCSNRTEMLSSLSSFDVYLPAHSQQTPSHIGNSGNRCYSAGAFATQGTKKSMNIEDRFDCGLCPKYRGETRNFASTRSLRNHQRKFHEKPREAGGKPRKVDKKPSNANKERDDSLKALKTKMRKLQEQDQEMGKGLEEFEKMLGKVIQSTYGSPTSRSRTSFPPEMR
jgi:hypothetical protein